MSENFCVSSYLKTSRSMKRILRASMCFWTQCGFSSLYTVKPVARFVANTFCLKIKNKNFFIQVRKLILCWREHSSLFKCFVCNEIIEIKKLALSCGGAVSLIPLLHYCGLDAPVTDCPEIETLVTVIVMLLTACLRRCARLLCWIPVTIVIMVVMWSYYAYVVHFCWSK